MSGQTTVAGAAGAAPEPALAAAPAPADAAPAPAAPPAAAPAPEAAQPPAEAIPEAKAAFAPHTDTPDLLADAPKPEPGKPADAAKPAPEAPAFAGYEFKWPDTVKAPAEDVEKLTAILGEHRFPAEAAQKLVDLHSEVVTRMAQDTLARQHQVFGETRAGWRARIAGDPILGGAGAETARRDVMLGIELLVPAEDRKDFDEFRAATGGGDHPALHRLLYRAAQRFKEPAPVRAAAPPSDAGKKPRGAAKEDFFTHSTSRRST